MNSRSRVFSTVSRMTHLITMIVAVVVLPLAIPFIAQRLAIAYTRSDAAPAVKLHSPTTDAIDDESSIVLG